MLDRIDLGSYYTWMVDGTIAIIDSDGTVTLYIYIYIYICVSSVEYCDAHE